MEIDKQIRTQVPYHLARLYEIASLEIEPRLRVMKFIELYEHALRYLALVGLAEYLHRGLTAEPVEVCRPGLERPSLGHWLALLRAADDVLGKAGYPLHSPPLNMIFREGPIFEAYQRLAPLAEVDIPAKIRMGSFLELLVQFRNKRIGHGSITYGEAGNVVQFLETGLIVWLDGLRALTTRHLLYIDLVEWTGDQYSYSGHDLNHGTSIFPFYEFGKTPIAPKRVYLSAENGQPEISLIPLYPFFAYDKDYTLLYVFNEFHQIETPVWRCSYANSANMLNLKIEINPTLILGANFAAQGMGIAG